MLRMNILIQGLCLLALCISQIHGASYLGCVEPDKNMLELDDAFATYSHVGWYQKMSKGNKYKLLSSVKGCMKKKRSVEVPQLPYVCTTPDNVQDVHNPINVLLMGTHDGDKGEFNAEWIAAADDLTADQRLWITKQPQKCGRAISCPFNKPALPCKGRCNGVDVSIACPSATTCTPNPCDQCQPAFYSAEGKEVCGNLKEPEVCTNANSTTKQTQLNFGWERDVPSTAVVDGAHCEETEACTDLLMLSSKLKPSGCPSRALASIAVCTKRCENGCSVSHLLNHLGEDVCEAYSTHTKCFDYSLIKLKTCKTNIKGYANVGGKCEEITMCSAKKLSSLLSAFETKEECETQCSKFVSANDVSDESNSTEEIERVDDGNGEETEVADNSKDEETEGTDSGNGEETEVVGEVEVNAEEKQVETVDEEPKKGNKGKGKKGNKGKDETSTSIVIPVFVVDSNKNPYESRDVSGDVPRDVPGDVWVPSTVLAGKGCMSTYALSNNVITCADGSTWIDNEMGQVRRITEAENTDNNSNTNDNDNVDVVVVTPTSDPNLEVWSSSSVLAGLSCVYKNEERTAITCNDGSTWIVNEVGQVRKTSTESTDAPSLSTDGWMPRSVLDDRECVFNPDSSISCQDGTLWIENEVGQVRSTGVVSVVSNGGGVASVVVQPIGDTRIKNQMVVYDFDQTIAKLHVYKQTNGKTWEQLKIMHDQGLIDIADFFGTPERISEIRRHFQNVFADDKLQGYILSFSFNDVIYNFLEYVDLDGFFPQEHILGRDHDLVVDRAGVKHEVIQVLQRQHNISSQETLYIDDDIRNIYPAIEFKTARVVYIREEAGMNSGHLRAIELLLKNATEGEVGDSDFFETIANSNNPEGLIALVPRVTNVMTWDTKRSKQVLVKGEDPEEYTLMNMVTEEYGMQTPGTVSSFEVAGDFYKVGEGFCRIEECTGPACRSAFNGYTFFCGSLNKCMEVCGGTQTGSYKCRAFAHSETPTSPADASCSTKGGRCLMYLDTEESKIVTGIREGVGQDNICVKFIPEGTVDPSVPDHNAEMESYCSAFSTPCDCVEGQPVGCGWYATGSKCLPYGVTSCEECPLQPACNVTFDLSYLQTTLNTKECKDVKTACECAQLEYIGKDCGWSDSRDSCLQGGETTCTECPSQPMCARTTNSVSQVYPSSSNPYSTTRTVYPGQGIYSNNRGQPLGETSNHYNNYLSATGTSGFPSGGFNNPSGAFNNNRPLPGSFGR